MQESRLISSTLMLLQRLPGFVCQPSDPRFALLALAPQLLQVDLRRYSCLLLCSVTCPILCTRKACLSCRNRCTTLCRAALLPLAAQPCLCGCSWLIQWNASLVRLP